MRLCTCDRPHEMISPSCRQHNPARLDPATWAHTRAFLAILEESGMEVACAQFFLTPAEAEEVCAWAKARPAQNPTVIIVDDDPETDDFREPDPGPSPAGRIVGSAPPSAADDANALALQAAHCATAGAHDLIGFTLDYAGPFPAYVSHQIVLHLADALHTAIVLHERAENEGDPIDADLALISVEIRKYLERAG